MRTVIVVALPCLFGLVGLAVPGGPSREERLAHADDVIDNDGEFAKLASQVLVLHESYLRLAASHAA